MNNTAKLIVKIIAIVAAIAAVVCAVYTFREEICDFFAGLKAKADGALHPEYEDYDDEAMYA